MYVDCLKVGIDWFTVDADRSEAGLL